MKSSSLKRLAAFTNSPEGGNPAGVWVGESLPSPAEMQRIATQVGFSETAFVAPQTGKNRIVRYFSPEAEVPFCGHATIATGVALGEEDGEGTYLFETSIGDIPVQVGTEDGVISASLTSVEPKYKAAENNLVEDVLSALSWNQTDLDEAIPPRAGLRIV